VVLFIIALLLIALILIQPSKSGGMGAAFGGIGESVFGGKAGSHLTKTTVVMTAVFFVVALGLAAVIGRSTGSSGDDLREKLLVEEKAAGENK
jgi:preprotein translocase subunit SecG